MQDLYTPMPRTAFRLLTKEDIRPMDMHGVAEDKATYTARATDTGRYVSLGSRLVTAIARAHLPGIESAVLLLLADSLWEITPTPHFAEKQISAPAIAGRADLEVHSVRKAMTMLKARNIIIVTKQNSFTVGNLGDVITLNADTATWRTAAEIEDERAKKCVLKKPRSQKSENTGSQKSDQSDAQKSENFLRESLKRDLREEEKINNNNNAREISAHDISHDVKQEPTIATRMPFTKTYQARPPVEPEIVPPPLVAVWDKWRLDMCGIGTELMNGNEYDVMRRWEKTFGLERCVLAIEWLFVSKVDPAQPPTFGTSIAYLEEVLKTSLNSKLPPGQRPQFKKQVLDKPAHAPPTQRLTRLDPMDAYKKKRVPPVRALEVSP